MPSATFLSSANTNLVNLFKLLGTSNMRVGAGSVDTHSWKGQAPGLIALSEPSVDALAGFAQATGWSVTYAINFVTNTLPNIAAEAAYAKSKLGTMLRYFELGNEVDIYPFANKRPSTYSYNDYLFEWREMRNNIVAAVSGAKFVGPSSAGADINNYPQRFANDERAGIEVLTHHYYIDNGSLSTSTIDRMLAPDPRLATILTTLVQAATKNNIPGGFVLNEANSYWNYGAPGVSNTFASSLWVIDFLFTCALAGCRGVNMHIPNTNSNVGYVPIYSPNLVVTNVQPDFYGMFLFARGARGTVLPATVKLQNTSANVSAYAVERADGGRNIFLLNKDSTTTLQVDLQIGASARDLVPTWLQAPTLASTSGQLLNGSVINIDGSWQPRPQQTLVVSNGRATLQLPPATAVLLESR